MNDSNGTSGASTAKFDPSSPIDWSNLGAALLSQGRHEDAIGCWDKSLGLDPRLAATWTKDLDEVNAELEKRGYELIDGSGLRME